MKNVRFFLWAPAVQIWWNKLVLMCGDTHLWFFISHGHSFGASLRCHTKNTSARTYSFPVKLFEPYVRGHEPMRVHSTGWWVATGYHVVESAVWAWAGESQCALKRHSAAHERAQRNVFFCQVYKGTFISQHTPYHPAHLPRRPALFSRHYHAAHCTYGLCLHFLFFFHLTLKIPAAILFFLSGDEEPLKLQ